VKRCWIAACNKPYLNAAIAFKHLFTIFRSASTTLFLNKEILATKLTIKIRKQQNYKISKKELISDEQQ
jgi:hypothetical protein